MREFDVEVTMQNGAVWFLHYDLFVTAGIVDKPEATIGNAVRGSNSPVFLAYKQANVKTDSTYIVARNIQSFKVIYR
ncbi:hypothetical protein BI004_gp081 [Bacillus phage NotTheCreek]|uniref:Uncharacterized protein n=2 Tax=Wphvirus hakuna TaxID=1987729 RepID=A0A222Z2R7_9CAUD|nr:hypothetical protein FP72_gp076 [Bacillus phage Hakuna]YP_009279250.1 hypothetical protein BIZ89_gp083 [Bacillus phage Kida]YP_009284409.1 hypothetical protein BI004_gp081 [Bacillus phage NotTheCreek]ASR78320.1 hypothetical protein PPISBEST_83 [Bacillus phage PPIsBest]QDH49357.1 hypothetical protein PHIREBALL_82 [Bacillus phage Phireball]QDH50064.1 hypothetical protein ALPS_78 [Bacillus phage ALPS]ULF48992.1 hypothetical protein [Bacillus phage Darren]ULF49288.1 hypothetical protein [Baci